MRHTSCCCSSESELRWDVNDGQSLQAALSEGVCVAAVAVAERSILSAVSAVSGSMQVSVVA